MLSAHVVSSQNQVRPQSYGQWFMYFGDNKLSSKIGIHSELQLRNYLLNNTVEQTLTRIGLNYYIDPKVMLTSGYGFIYTAPTSGNIEGQITSEHRIWQQLVLRQSTKQVAVEHRYRLEQRFIENFTSGKHNFDNRLRYRVQLSLSLNFISVRLNNFSLVAYNELFLNLGRKVSGQIFDRNRLYGAVSYKVSPAVTVQTGYLHQVISIPNLVKPDTNHNLQLAFVFNPVLGRTKSVVPVTLSQ
jgi:hypothetical protein